ncbi:response regulator [Flavobacterium okayamense]|uniref:histidine kinase n=1 Tax=Flavobacterium okayamense TaxID=2830782 RepID=A0ABN6HXX0_9FLAO|nr:response regulator [Flavobacterium okayamense]BCY29220.1 histidine kinase [Flavobacterium okayamense]
MNLNYFKNSNLLARNYVFIISLFCFFSSNSQNYSSDSLSILNFKSEISKAEDLIAVKEGNSYQEGIDLFNKIEGQIKATKDTLLLLDFYKIRTENYFQNFDYENSLTYILKGFRLNKSYKSPKYLGIYYELLGVIYYSLEKDEARNIAFLKAEYYLRNYGSNEENIDINFNLAVINKDAKNWDETVKYSLQSLDLITKTQKALVRRKYLYAFLAESYLNLENLSQADYYLNKIESDINFANDKLLLIASYYGLKGVLYQKKGKYKEASSLLQKSNEAYNKLSFERTKQIKASLKEKSNFQLQELENKKIKREIELIETNNSYKNILIGLGAVLCLSLLIFSFIQYRNSHYRAKMNLLLQKKNNELQERNIQIKAALNTKNKFLDTITHELRTPLNSIKGASFLLSKENENNDFLVETLNFSSDYLLNLINNVIEINILDKSDEITIHKNTFNINSLLLNCSNSVSINKKKEVEIITDINPNVPRIVIGDSFRLSQVLINLLENAIKFTKEGFVKIKVHKVSQTGEKVRLGFKISDSGIGIKEKNIKKILEPFKHASTKVKEEFGGSGLGLTVANKILHALNSQLEIKSKSNEGTEVFFELDFITQNESDNIETLKPSEEFSDTNDIRVLLVEDNKINQAITQKILQSKGFKCDVANNGLEALNKVIEDDYSLILMDIMMPVMDGFEASEKINNIKPYIPIIALTAVYEEVNKDKFEKAKIKEVLNKPVKIDVLYKTVLKNLNITNL